MAEFISKTWGALAVPITIFITTFWNRRHANEIEDTKSQSDAMTAITDANATLTKLMTSALEPLQRQIDSQTRLLEEHKQASRKELDRHQRQIDRQRHAIDGFYRWVLALRRQLVNGGFEPQPPPVDLDLDGFTFD